MVKKPVPANLARRHFMAVVASGAGRLSAIALSSALLIPTKGEASNGNEHGRSIGRPGPGGIWEKVVEFDRPGRPGPTPDRPGPRRKPECFCQGTLVATSRGEVAVEHLSPGDLVITTNGVLPIKWIGRQTITKNGSAVWHPSVRPVRISRSAIDEEQPRRDLYLSPDHCLLIDGVLIPVKHLVNESSIVVDELANTIETITYFAIELEKHELIYAEGMLTETYQYQYTAGQVGWDNREEYEVRYGAHRYMEAVAPIFGYKGGRAQLAALLRLGASCVVDVRDPIQRAYHRIAKRATLLREVDQRAAA